MLWTAGQYGPTCLAQEIKERVRYTAMKCKDARLNIRVQCGWKSVQVQRQQGPTPPFCILHTRSAGTNSTLPQLFLFAFFFCFEFEIDSFIFLSLSLPQCILPEQGLQSLQ